MKKRWLYVTIVLGMTALLCNGCGKSNESPKVKKSPEINHSSEEQKEMEKDVAEDFPESYSKTSESGKVIFDCSLEVPENLKKPVIHRMTVQRRNSIDQEKAYKIYVEGKEISEKHVLPAENGLPEETSYIFSDGSSCGIWTGIRVDSKNALYYDEVSVSDGDYRENYKDDTVDFKTDEACIQEVKTALEALGYQSEDFIFQAYPVNHKSMEQVEMKKLQEELMEEKYKKSSWGPEDDGYVIYAYQQCENIPIFHERMSMNRMFSYETADNAPIQAICSARGIESINTGDIYDVVMEEEKVYLKDFQEIAQIVEDKFENILNDATYKVTKAKLYEMVRYNEKQQYEAEPIWRFEILENDSTKSVTLINGETGKEIFLN